VEDGLLPHHRSSEDPEETEEERRLFFVGITRAKANLSITYARYRTMRGILSRTVPSQFLYELGAIEQIEDVSSKLLQELTYEPFYDDALSHKDTEAFFKKHDMVRHKKFGIGRVQNFVDTGENSTITVKFNSGQTKTLLLKYAKLVKL
jgi:DNA helicase-2/ATP-dependent DNA helicase PcrA